MTEQLKLTKTQQQIVDMLKLPDHTLRIHTTASSSPVTRYAIYNGQTPIKTVRANVFSAIVHLLKRIEYHPLSETWKLK